MSHVLNGAAADRDHPSSPVISLSGVSKRFRSRRRGPVHALSDATLEVQEGEFLALLGPSGCGKTTLLRLMAGLEQPSAGRASLLGNPVQGPSESAALVFQSSVLLPWRTVLQNVLLPVEVRRLPLSKWKPKALDLLERTGLSQFADSYPRELSGGMKQRASICRALLMDPPILFMDEPFGALDAITRSDMNEELFNIWGSTQKTIVFVTHDIAEAVRLASRVAVMSPRPGRISTLLSLDLPQDDYRARLEDPAIQSYEREIEKIVENVS